MRIVGGALRGRRLDAPAGSDVRPTADRARQTLFDMIAHGSAFAGFTLAGTTVADVFAGTGACGLEALSRGAARAIFVESDRTALASLRDNIAKLDQDDRCRVIARDASRPGPAPTPCDLVFLDPPYHAGLALPALAALADNGWLAANAMVIVEHASDETLSPPSGFAAVESRKVGAAIFAIWHIVP
jgi:16S rRNA (guanine966-N2)-methyltransferase